MLSIESKCKRLDKATEKINDNNSFLFQERLCTESIHWPRSFHRTFSFKTGLFDQGHGFRLLDEATPQSVWLITIPIPVWEIRKWSSIWNGENYGMVSVPLPDQSVCHTLYGNLVSPWRVLVTMTPNLQLCLPDSLLACKINLVHNIS
jgi:hypothetical protein